MRGYFQASNAVIECGFTPGEAYVYAYLAKHANKEKQVLLSYTDISKGCKMGRETVIKAISLLEIAGLLEKKVRRSGKCSNYTNEYTILFDVNLDVARSKVEAERSKQAEEKRELDRLERKGRLMLEAVRHASAVRAKVTRKQAIAAGREVEQAQGEEQTRQKWGVAIGI